jgi:histidyl-tRNA synthetase
VKITGVKGMNDILPASGPRWRLVEESARAAFERAGYREVRTPIVEKAALFARGVGETTDIVNKEMYAFEDKGEEQLALRPEGTAGTVRAFIEHGCHVEGLVKWYYAGPMFRRERPQKGRYRQFHQLGCEAFGSDNPALDVEQIAMLDQLFARLSVRCQLRLNSVGDDACRPPYLKDLVAHLGGRRGELCKDCNERLERNPLRVLDCKVESCQPVLEGAPRLLDRLCAPCAEHFAAVKAGLTAGGVAFVIDSRLVRGLDYYTRTAFEFTSDALGSQSAVAGGGRYDKLVELLGGQATPAFGFAMGEERLVMVLEALQIPVPATGPEVFLVSVDPEGAREALRLVMSLRRAGIAADFDPRAGKVKTQFRQAERMGARRVLVLGGDEVRSGRAKLKLLATGEESPVGLDRLAAALAPDPKV